MTVVRWTHPAVRGLDLWDVVLPGGVCLTDPLDPAALVTALGRALAALQQGTARSRTHGVLPATPFARVVLAGGRANDPAVRAGLTSLPVPSAVHTDPGWAFQAGAGVVAGNGEALLVDVGQTAVKVVTRGQRRRVPRPFGLLPARSPDGPAPTAAHVAEQRQRLRGFLAGALRDSGPADVVVMAQPCRLDTDGTPGGCSYVGMEDDRTLVTDVLREAGLSPGRTAVLNDAEAVAVGVGSAQRGADVVLVVTLGFGIGAAVVDPTGLRG